LESINSPHPEILFFVSEKLSKEKCAELCYLMLTAQGMKRFVTIAGK
jgi:hypothetical protein